MCVLVFLRWCEIPAWLSICLLSLVVWQCFSGPLIQYDHFTVPGGKWRYSAQHTQHTHNLLLACRVHTGCAGPRWWVRDAGTRHRFRPQTNRRRPGGDKLQGLPCQAAAVRLRASQSATLRRMEASIDFSLCSDRAPASAG